MTQHSAIYMKSSAEETSYWNPDNRWGSLLMTMGWVIDFGTANIINLASAEHMQHAGI